MSAESLQTWLVGQAGACHPAPGHPISTNRPSVAAFVGRTRRGPVNRPVVVHSFADYQKVFGGHTAWSWLSHMVAQFFDNGGQRAHIVRVVNSGACATLHVPAGDARVILRARDPGRHECLRVSIDHDQLEHDSSRFNMVVQRLSDGEPRRVVDQEIFRRLSIRPGDADFLGDVLMRSVLMRLASAVPPQRPDRTLSSSVGDAVSYIDIRADGHDGAELSDYDLIGSATEGTGLFALAAVDELALLCLPPPSPSRDLGLPALVVAERFCRERNMMLVFDPPLGWDSADAALRASADFGFSSANAATYFPRLIRRGESAARRFPACGAIAGMLARKDAIAGIWRALDSQTGLLRGPWMVAEDVGPDDALTLCRRGINVLSRSGSGGCLLRGDVTFAGNSASAPQWRNLTHRRLALHVLDSVSRATRWLVFENNDPVLWARVRRQVSAFLQQLHEQGAFAGLTPEQSYFVKCDGDTVVRDSSGEPHLNVLIGIALSRPGEFQIFGVAHQPGATRISSLPLTRALSLAR